MADRYAVESGVWSDPDTWDGGTLPEPGDTVRPNGKTVTVDMATDGQILRNNAASPATTGGRFQVAPDTDGVVFGGVHAATAALLTVGSGAEVLIDGDVTGGTATTAYGVNVTSGGAVTIEGDVTGGTFTNAHGVNVSGGAVTIEGDVTGGTNAYGVFVNTGVLDAFGSVFASAGYSGIYGSNNAGMTIRVTGPLHSHPNGTAPIFAPKWRVHPYPHNTVWYMTDDQDAPNGLGNPVPMSVWNEHTPPPSDVRAGKTYGLDGYLTGTLNVPPPQSVAAGVPTDDTTGTAALTASDVWDHPTADTDTPDSIGLRLRDTATVASTGAQISAALDTGDEP